MAAPRTPSNARMNMLADRVARTIPSDDVGGDPKSLGAGGGGGSARGGPAPVVMPRDDVPYKELREMYTQLAEKYRRSSNEHQDLLNQLKRRQESYLRSELDYREQLSNMEEKLHIGGDSLSAARLANMLIDERVKVNAQTVFEYSLEHLDHMLQSSLRGVAVVGSIKREIDWSRECALPRDLVTLFGASSETSSTQSVQGEEKKATTTAKVRLLPDCSSLTLILGCTGFLGPVLVKAVLDRYADQLDGAHASMGVVCIVRAKTDNDAAERLFADMKKAKVFSEQLCSAKRLCVLCGDVSRDRFGLSEDTYASLSRVNNIFHSAARVNMALPYSVLREANVGGTLKAIELAARNGACIHYVSSVGALGEPAQEDWTRLAARDVGAKSGYASSKYVSERVLHAALEAELNSSRSETRPRGRFDVNVFRPTAISCALEQGVSNPSDLTSLLILACVSIGAVPKDCKAWLHWIPVDFVASACVSLATNAAATTATTAQGTPQRQSEKQRPRVFHLAGRGPRLSEVGAALRELGYKCEEVPEHDWRARIRRLPEDHQTATVASSFQTMEFAQEAPALPCAIAERELRTRGMQWPQITHAHIITALRGMQKAGFLPDPEDVALSCGIASVSASTEAAYASTVARMAAAANTEMRARRSTDGPGEGENPSHPELYDAASEETVTSRT